jgi:hypothetical protein
MAGIVWFVQLVHYPLLARVGPDRFRETARSNLLRTAAVAGVPMTVEGAGALLLVARPPSGVPRPWAWLGLGLLLGIWASTCLREIPRHRALLRGFDPRVHRALVAGNWRRTALWSLRAVLALAMLDRAER